MDVKRRLAGAARSVAGSLGFDLVRRSDSPRYPADFDAAAVELCERVAPYTLTSPERVLALRDAVRVLVATGVPGAFVECGVWRGGSAMVMAATLHDLGVDDRDLYLFDTFTHMPFPGEHDVDVHGRSAAEYYHQAAAADVYRYLPFDEVRAAVASTGYPQERVHFVQGLVEDTIPDRAPEQIALCRLDTDWYESTAHEMEHLWPRISDGGVLLVDDYGHFRGARKAVDEHFARHDLTVHLHRVDLTGRVVVKRDAG